MIYLEIFTEIIKDKKKWLSNILLNFFNFYFLIYIYIFLLVITYSQKIPYI